MIAAMMLPDFDRSQMRFKLFIVDEAQDNSNALWNFAKLVIAESKESVVAGDDDQAIMEQFGASPKAFLDLETTKKDIELKISYRLPSEVKKALDEGPGADIKKIKGRKEKKFRIASDAKKGSIISNFISFIKGKKITERFRLFNLIMDLQDTSIEGDWLIMAPTNHTVEFISSVLYKFDIAHYSKNKPITLKGQKSVDTEIRVQTIHTSKGAEAENVALVLKSQGDFDMYTQGNDESARLAYVAESRTKNRMYHIGFHKRDDKTIIDDSDEVFLNND
jgi:superfamily I DNA/RNA helicase